MELRAPFRLTLRRAAGMAALAALLVPATAPADADAAKRRGKAPVITSVKPLRVAVGETLTIRGRHFVRGRNRNSVVFRRAGARPLFVKAELGTTKLLKVTVPGKLEAALTRRSGAPVPTRFRLRVLSARLSRAFTAERLSPMIEPERPPTPPTPPKPAAEGDCDGDRTLNGVDLDDDNDLLEDGREEGLKLDTCKLDTDGDGVEDGYEYRSAQDLNDDDYQSPDAYLPYPVKRPYPNPLFADGGVDYDGDGLTLADEQALWRHTTARWAPRDLLALTYSDGEQYTRDLAATAYRSAPADESPAQRSAHAQWFFLRDAAAQGYSESALLNFNGLTVASPVKAQAGPAGDAVVTDLERHYFDADHNGRLRDDELDEDADGLSNYDEVRGSLSPSWWTTFHAKERAYVVEYAGTQLDDPDSDGDGVLDGADDQDHDDIPNVRELSRRLSGGEELDGSLWSVGAAPGTIEWLRGYDDIQKRPAELYFGNASYPWALPAAQPARAWVNPFNPCLPNPHSRTCPPRIPSTNAWAPWGVADDDVFYVLN